MTGSDCGICHEVEEAFKKHYKEELDSGEASIVNLDEDEGAYEFWATHELPLAPVMVVTTDGGKLITILDSEDLKEALPAAEADKQS